MKRFTLVLSAAVAVVGVFGIQDQASAACPARTSPIKIITRDANGKLLPGMNAQVFHKNIDPDGNPYFGTSPLATTKTDAGGQSTVCVRDDGAPYAVKIYQKNPNFGYFSYWDIYEPQDQFDVSTVEVSLGGIQTIFRDATGTLLKNVVFDIFLQSFDIDGDPVVDVTKLDASKLVASDFNTQVFGTTRAYLTDGHYVIRVHGTGNTYFYLWDQEVNTEEETLSEFHLGTMRIVLQDGFGTPVKNQLFNLYRQMKDVRGNPIFGEPVATGLSTGTTGKYDAYLPPGTYALRVAGSGDTSYRSYNHRIGAEEYKIVPYRMSGVRIVIRGPDGDLGRTIKFSFATQTRDALGNPVVGRYIVKNRTTGEPGFVDLYLPQGTYLLIVGTQRLAQIDIFDKQFTSVDWPRTITFRPTSELTVATPISNTGFTVRQVTQRLPGYLGPVERVSKIYRFSARRMRAAYAITFTADRAKLDDLGLSARSLRIAFYSTGTKRWSLIGKVDTARRQVRATVKSLGYAALVGRY